MRDKPQLPNCGKLVVLRHNINAILCDINQPNRQRIQGNELRAIGERKDSAETVNLINIAKK